MKKDANSILEMYILGIFVRFWLATSEYQKIIADRIEISTPINSWKRVIEALHLENLSINPYIGDRLHESPLHLAAYRILVATCSNHLFVVFVGFDVATALLLHVFAKKCIFYLQNIERKNHSSGDVQEINSDSIVIPEYVAAAYLFNPYTILNCVGYTTTVFANFFAALFLTGLIYGHLLVTTLSLAICIEQNLYFISLICPLLIHFSNRGKVTIKPVIAVSMVAIFWTLFMYWSYRVNNNWNFIINTYGFVLAVSDLRPNIGLFWYFFTEIFEQFRVLFIYSFQINVTLLYLIPLSIRFRNDPMLLASSLISLIAIFKSYPCLGDVGFTLAVLCCWKRLFKYTQQCFLVGCSFCMTTALAPTVWHLWIYAGSANANFYFGVTLAFGTTLIFLIIDTLFAYVKREFQLVFGHTPKTDGQGIITVLE